MGRRGPKERETQSVWVEMRRKLLDELGETQVEQAEALGVTQAAVGTWRSTRAGPPRSVLEQLALCALSTLSDEERRRAVLAGLHEMRKSRGQL